MPWPMVAIVGHSAGLALITFPFSHISRWLLALCPLPARRSPPGLLWPPGKVFLTIRHFWRHLSGRNARSDGYVVF